MDNGFDPMNIQKGNPKMAKRATKAKVEKPDAGPVAPQGHNSGLDPAAERVFIREFQNVKDAESDMAESKGTLAQIYKRLDNAGFPKEMIAFAKSLEKRNVSEVISEFELKIKICRLMGHAAGRQLNMFEKDRTPLEDKAYEDGKAAGLFGRNAVNSYGMASLEGQAWQRGFNDGNVARNEALNEEINGEIIKVDAGDQGNNNGEPPAPEDADATGDTPEDDWDAAAPTPEAPAPAEE